MTEPLNEVDHHDDFAQTEAERLADTSVSLFPSVESVLDDIGAFLEAHGPAAHN